MSPFMISEVGSLGVPGTMLAIVPGSLISGSAQLSRSKSSTKRSARKYDHGDARGGDTPRQAPKRLHARRKRAHPIHQALADPLRENCGPTVGTTASRDRTCGR